MKTENNNNQQTELRIIKTARTEQAINEAAKEGFWPIVKPVIPSPEIRAKYAIKQDKETGKITVGNDYRAMNIPMFKFDHDTQPTDTDVIIGWTYFYPYQFESPFAAYLVPNDLGIGELVVLEDLIEDVVGAKWNQGDTYRLKSCEAVWDGKEFVLQHKPTKVSGFVG
ncbi:hypothetical protein [Mucilaginibacter sp. HD30]